MIARRRAKIIESLGSIQNVELIKCNFVNLAWQFSGMTAGNAVE